VPTPGQQLAGSLRLLFADIIAEGVPERFAEILRRLDEPSNEGSKDQPTSPYQSNSNSM
jgi:Anti-sigma factor NepR